MVGIILVFVLRVVGSYCYFLGCGGDDIVRFVLEEEFFGYSMAIG